MHVGIRSEHQAREGRVAATPQSVESLVELGATVSIESGAGRHAGISDDAFTDAGASVVASLHDAGPIDILATVGPIGDSNGRSDMELLSEGSVVIGLLDPTNNETTLSDLQARGVTPIAMELVPRTTIAQSMDALSSQATAAGYAAVLLGATSMPKFMPMLVTAAGTVPPARVLVLGVGVAGLQAIATAKRLGAIVTAYDIRPETKEQVESLGAKFIDAPTQQMDEGGYARAVDEETAAAQREVLTHAVAGADLIITTAQVPGRKAPILVDAEMVKQMSEGSVIIDMAAGSGGNVVGSQPDHVVNADGVMIHGPTDLASRVAADASRMYARNVLEIIKRMVVDGNLAVDADDAVIGPAIVGRTAAQHTDAEQVDEEQPVVEHEASP
ncbi:MAG: NAD(P) transhydrogenase subunit alpha [Armatimonadetes bacterium]|nr:MAG: NAD(P) transhydrogenase subunit alpha [Armatimonadota bacterium]